MEMNNFEGLNQWWIMSQSFKIEVITPIGGVILLHFEWEAQSILCNSIRSSTRGEVHSELQVLVHKFVFVKQPVVLFSPTADTLFKYYSMTNNKKGI